MRSILAIALGASLGALLRWQLGTKLNALFPVLPLGTLMANLVGGLIIGMAVVLFAQMPQWSPLWRLLIITGFCGGLTTFSTFSAEVMGLLQEGRIQWAIVAIGVHVTGSLLMTFLGMLSTHWFLHR